jgi:hypothetical protein
MSTAFEDDLGTTEMLVTVRSPGSTTTEVTSPESQTELEVKMATRTVNMSVVGGLPGKDGRDGIDAVGAPPDPGDLTVYFENALV